MTEYHDFDEYAQGDENWEYNTEFQLLDALVWKVGLAANRPATAPDGRLYLATDAGRVDQYDDGAGSWTEGVLEDTQLDPSTIDPGDLGFDPATQSELDTHEADADAHHAKTVSGDIVHDDTQGGTDADAHHTKTTSASDLTDVSADSVADAHHTKYTDEEVRDVVGAALAGGTNVTVTVDDAGDTITLAATDTDTQRTDEEIEDVVGALLAGGTNVSLTYDDAGDTLTIDATDTQLTESEVQTAVNNDADHGSTASHDYFSGDHADLSGVQSDQHHTKTTSASDLTDVSADSVSDAHHAKTVSGDIDHDATVGGTDADAHHAKYTDGEAQTAVEGSVDAADLTGASGTDGQVLTSDGSLAAWEDAPSGGGGTDPDSQALADGLIVYAGAGARGTVDPSGTATPVQDAVDAIGRESAGYIWLPSGTIQETGPILGLYHKSLIGPSVTGCKIEITGDNDGIAQDSSVGGSTSQDLTGSYLHGFGLSGDGVSGGRTQGSAIHLDQGSCPQFNVGALDIGTWTGPDPIIHFDAGNMFDSKWGVLRVGNATSTGDAFKTDSAGSHNRIGHLLLNTSDGHALNFAGSYPQWSIGGIQVTVGGDSNSIFNFDIGNTAHLDIGTLNFEPVVASPVLDQFDGSAVVRKSAGGYVNIESILIQGGSVTAEANYGFFDRGGQGNWEVGSVRAQDGATLLENEVGLHNDSMVQPAHYGGGQDGFDYLAVSGGATLSENITFGDGSVFWSNNQEGTVTLSGGAGTDDTGISPDGSWVYDILASPQAAGDVAVSLERGASSYIVHVEENTTSNNPDVDYRLVRS